MDTRIFHGDIVPEDIANVLIAQFNRNNYRAQRIGSLDKIIVQITTREMASSGGQTALAVNVQKAADGVAVQLGKQSWFGVAASLGQTAFTAWRNPLGLLSRLDDLAQDIENLQLSDAVWQAIEGYPRSTGATFELSERLRRVVCVYCDTANPVGEASCLACGAPLGQAQPRTCLQCGFVVRSGESKCPNCGKALLR